MEVKDYGEIPLRNKVKEVVGWAKCSLEDYEELNKYKWNKGNGNYAQSNIKNKSWVMHLYVKEVIEKQIIPVNMMVDHENHDRIDNRRCNLRLATRKQNNLNSTKQKNTSSIYRGVFKKKNGNFDAQIHDPVTKGRKYLGCFGDEISAAIAYDLWAFSQLDFCEGFRLLNFPENVDYYKTNPLSPVSIKKTKISQFRGVTKKHTKFFASVQLDGKRIIILRSKSEIECAKAYDNFIYTNKINRKLNFPMEYPTHLIDYVPKIKTNMKHINTNTVQLFPKQALHIGQKILIDLEDYDKVKYFKIWVNNDGYVNIVRHPTFRFLHRLVMSECNESVLVDHIDSNPLNCTKQNLRKATPLENARNKKKQKGSISNYFGVHKRKNRYVSKVVIEWISYTRNFILEQEGARWRDLIILEHVPNSTFKMNFQWTNDEIIEWRQKFNMKT